jgi:phytoene dehydrogenase-like protein
VKTRDVVVIGAGHNGLTAAACLARAGRSVLVLERRSIVGGTLVTEAVAPGFSADMVQSGTLRPGIVRDLGLKRFGFPPAPARPAFISLLPGSAPLVLDADPARAAGSIARFSKKDATRWPAFVDFLEKAAAFLDVAYETPMPRLPKVNFSDGFSLLALAMELRAYGREEMMAIIRALPMSVQELLEEWFESDVIRAAVASLGVHGLTLGAASAGTAFNLIHNWLNRGGLAHGYCGRAEEIAQALAGAVKGHGGEVRAEAEATHVLVEDGRATGVALVGGEVLAAKVVLSAVDPKRTFLSLVGPMELPPTFVWNVQSIRMRGSVAKMHLALERLPEGFTPGATHVIAPSLRHLERAYDAAKYGEVAGQPYLEITTTGNVASVHVQYAPYHLRGGTWDQKRDELEAVVLGTLKDYFPDLGSLIVAHKCLTPLDLERTYSLTEGDLNHGQLMLDQTFFMRPIPGWSDHRTPVDGLYLGGSGVHGGGGISGAAGRNAAKKILMDKA